MRLIDADALKADHIVASTTSNTPCHLYVSMEQIANQPTVDPWHRVEEEPPDEKTDAIFYYEWTGISGTVYRETSIVSLNELIALGCRPIAWMEKPEPPKEDKHGN